MPQEENYYEQLGCYWKETDGLMTCAVVLYFLLFCARCFDGDWTQLLGLLCVASSRGNLDESCHFRFSQGKSFFRHRSVQGRVIPLLASVMF